MEKVKSFYFGKKMFYKENDEELYSPCVYIRPYIKSGESWAIIVFEMANRVTKVDFNKLYIMR